MAVSEYAWSDRMRRKRGREDVEKRTWKRVGLTATSRARTTTWVAAFIVTAAEGSVSSNGKQGQRR
jgi:hypothetical protein